VATVGVKALQFIRKVNGVYKRDYAFRMNVIEEIFEIRNCEYRHDITVVPETIFTASLLTDRA